MKHKQLKLLGWGVFLLILLVFFQTSSAHSYLENVEPPLGTLFDESPETVVLVYTQGPDTGLSEFFLQDVDGNNLYQFEPEYEGEDNYRVLLHFQEPLPDGHYHISWLAVSTTDGHPTRGIVPLAIGVELAATSEPHVEVSQASPVRMVVRWLMFLAMLILAGGLIFPLILPQQFVGEIRITKPLMLGSFIVLILAGLADIFMQSQEVGSSITKVLFESRWGQFQFAKYLAAAAIGALMLVTFAEQIKRYVLLVLAGLMLLAQAFASHNANLGPLGVAADWAHLTAAALWLSGLAQLAWIWIPRGLNHSDKDRLSLLKTLMLRFSQLALVSVVLILASGYYTMFQHIQSFDAFFNSLYGRALVAKGALLLPILILAAFNRFRLIPNLKPKANADDGTVRNALGKLKRWMSLEAAIIVVIVFFAATLTTTSPPHLAHADEHHDVEPLVVSTQVEEYVINTEFGVLDEGQRTLNVHVSDDAGNPSEGILRVMLRLEYLDQDLGDTFFNLVMDKNEDGSFTLTGPYLTLPGNWSFTTIVRISGRVNDIEIPINIVAGHDGAVAQPEEEDGHDNGNHSDENLEADDDTRHDESDTE